MIVYFLLPLFFRGQLFSAYEVLQQRFGGATKSVASLVFLVTRNVGDGLRLFLTALVLKAMINVPLSWCVVIVGVSTIIYTFAGGIKSVVWSDCIQFVVYVAGAILALVDHPQPTARRVVGVCVLCPMPRASSASSMARSTRG